VKSTKLIKTKTGNDIYLKKIIVMDKTNTTLLINIWDKQLAERATQWKPKKTSKQKY
jgi:hypothetical protein